MGISSWFGKKTDTERLLILHIGSASVLGAVVDRDGAEMQVIGSAATDITVLPSATLAEFHREMERALAMTLLAVMKFRFPNIDAVSVYLSSPWYASQVRTAKLSRPKPFVITRSVLEDIIIREQKAFTDEEITKSYEAGAPLLPLESLMVQVRLNGYAVVDPLGMSARELELSLLLSVTPETTVKRIREIVQHQMQKPIAFSSFLSALYSVSRYQFPHENTYLLVDVGGEVTEVSLVREGALIRSGSFPLGRNFVLRKLSAGLGRSIPEALSLCTLYAEDKVEAAVKEQCAQVLKEVKAEWLDGFQRALFSVSNELSVPSSVMLSVGADIAPWFIETIKREEFRQSSLTNKEFKVVLLDAELFEGLLSYAEGVRRDPCIIIEAVASAK